MRSTSLVWLLVAALIVTACGVAYAKRGQVTVKVVDVDAKGKEKKVAGAIVEIRQDGNVVESGVTDKKGKVTFSGLTGKTEYEIVVTAPDGTEHKKTFTTNKNGGAGLQRVDV